MNYVRAFWYSSNNFGDNLNNYLVRKISGLPCVYSERDKPHFIVCGSILSQANEMSTVWGAGFGEASQAEIMNPGANIVMVRGYESAALLKRDFDVVGDPALLLPLFYNPTIEKQYKVGVIPHWKDYEGCLNNLADVHIIDPFSSVEDFIDEVLKCETILCSGLHGLIVADAYKIPNRWIDFGTDIGGDGIKFRDYYSTTKTPVEGPATWGSYEFAVNEYKFDTQDLLNTCPFR